MVPIAVFLGAVEVVDALGADGNGRLYPVGDFLPLPLRHGGDHGEEKPPGGGAGVNRLLQGDHVSVAVAEDVGKVQKLLGVAGQPGELGKDEAADMALAD